ncbi:hypothetical protein CL622_00965 [archaeon]|nr:hypothetical protein [archaeon]|tara:strand:- start:3682 stop:4011 length:330 start_codon:yes stop_codon:yes gene_type:complete
MDMQNNCTYGIGDCIGVTYEVYFRKYICMRFNEGRLGKEEKSQFQKVCDSNGKIRVADEYGCYLNVHDKGVIEDISENVNGINYIFIRLGNGKLIGFSEDYPGLSQKVH